MPHRPTPTAVTCRRVFAATAVFAVAATPFTLAVPAHAVGTNVVDIQVTDIYKDTPVKNLSVTLVDTATGKAVAGATATTDTDGEATFSGLDDGAYTAKVATTAAYFEKYSTVVEVAASSVISNHIAVVPKTASLGGIKGSVSKTNGYVSAEAQIFPADTTEATILSGAAQPISTQGMSAYDYDGGEVTATWKSANLPVGDYKVLIGDRQTSSTWHRNPNGTSYWDGWNHYSSSVWLGAPAGTNTADAASVITIADEKTTATATVALPSSYVVEPIQVTGTVTGEDGIKLDNIRVTVLYDYDGEWHDGPSTYTDSTGAYTLRSSLDPGRYTLRFSDSRGDYKPEFSGDIPATGEWANPTSNDAVTTFTLDSGVHTESAVLSPNPIDRSTGVRGVFTDDLNRTRSSAEIEIYDVHGNYVGYTSTHRDGQWERATAHLAPGQYKFYVDSYEDDVISGWYGGKTYQAATTIEVPVTGATNAGASALQRYGSISGAVTLPEIARAEASWTEVVLYDVYGKEIKSRSAESGEPFSFRVRPGTYYVGAQGERWNEFEQSSYHLSWAPFIQQFWKGGFSLKNATAIKVGSGGTIKGMNFTLGRTLATVAAPVISGKATVGGVLTASTGSWNVTDDVAFSYRWKRGATVVGTSRTYKATQADADQKLTVTITATDANKLFASGSAAASVRITQDPVKLAQAKVTATAAAITKANSALKAAKKSGKKAAISRAKKTLASLKKQLKKDQAALSQAKKNAK